MNSRLPSQPPGWYPDPWGRYEHRYFNGANWTGDVSNGGQQMLDRPSQAPRTATPVNQPAVAGLILAGLAAVVSVVPYLFIFAIPAAIAGAVFALQGRRRAPEMGGTGRTSATVALAVVPLALAGCVGGWLLTRHVENDAKKLRRLDPSVVTVTRCAVDRGRLDVAGRFDSPVNALADVTLVVRAIAQSGSHDDLVVSLPAVPPNGRQDFTLQRSSVAIAVRCEVRAVSART